MSPAFPHGMAGSWPDFPSAFPSRFLPPQEWQAAVDFGGCDDRLRGMKKLLPLLCLFCLLVLVVPTPLTSKEFTGYEDVGAGMWSYGFIYRAQQEGFFDAASHFHPQQTVNRAQLAKMVYTMAQKKGLLQSGASEGAAQFADVSEDSWYFRYVTTVASLGFMTGYDGENGEKTGRFGPEDSVTRAQVAKVVALSSGISLPVNANYVPTFSDVDEAQWFYDAVRRVAFHCVMTGYEDGSFGAEQALTREQVAKVIVKVLSPGCDANGTSFRYDNTMYRYSLRYPSDYVVYAGLNREAMTFVPPTPGSEKVTVTHNDVQPFCCRSPALGIEAFTTTFGAKDWLTAHLSEYDGQGNLDNITELVFQGKKAVQYQGTGGAGSALRVIAVEKSDKDGKPFLLVLHLNSEDARLRSVLESVTFP